MIDIKKMHISQNYSRDILIKPEYVVIHETDNFNKGANALAHFHYWDKNENAKTSVHYVVDDTDIIQLLDLNQRAWHVGDNRSHSDITNDNTIGIEICVNEDGNYNIARSKAIKLTIHILKKLNLPIQALVRHFDASGKHCPRNMLDNKELWIDFVEKVKNGL